MRSGAGSSPPRRYRLVPISPPGFVPYIYSTAELQRLLAATAAVRTPKSPVRDLVVRTLLLLLYGTALRIGEALALTLADVDLDQALVTIRQTKFCKTRLVPIGPQLTAELAAYRTAPAPSPVASGAGVGLSCHAYRAAPVLRQRQPRLPSPPPDSPASAASPKPGISPACTTYAIRRPCTGWSPWYRAGDDVQLRLPQLATYLGHVDLSATQRYLTITPELLHEASRRFACYAHGEVRHAG